MKRSTLLHCLKFLLPLPCILGIIGYSQLYPGDYTSALYRSIQLYGFEYEVDDCNLLLDIARWTAPLLTTAYLLTGLQSVFYWLSCRLKIKFHKEKVLAVYGNNEKTATFLASLPPDTMVIQGKSPQDFHPVKRQVILFDKPEENFQFFQNHLADFREKDEIYLHLEGFSQNFVQDSRLEIHPFSLAKTSAFAFLTSEGEKLCKTVFAQDEVHIVLIGEGQYAQEWLDYAFNFHIFSVDQKIIYHIFGDFFSYAGIHYGLPQENTEDYLELSLYPKDKIRFYHQGWESYLGNLPSLDQVILCQEQDMENLALADQFIQYFPGSKLKENLYLRLSSEKMFQGAFQENPAISVFGTYEKSCTAPLILQETVIQSAKAQMAEYVQLNQKLQANAQEWKDQEPHIQASNLYSATYRATTFPMVPAHIQQRSPEEQLEFMSELEHIRWNRFHFLRNWSHTTEKLEKIQQRFQRRHTDLIDYCELSEEIKDYDRKEAKKVLEEYEEKEKS